MKQLKQGTVLILKKDFPPCPIGTKFTVWYGCVGDMYFKTPDFGDFLPNGQKIPSMSVKLYSEKADIFKEFGGWQEWFDVECETKIKEHSSHCILFEGEPLTDDIITEITVLLANKKYK